MKKILTIVAAVLMAATAFAAKDTVLNVNYAELAVANVEYGNKIDVVRNTEDKNKVNGTDMYPFSFGTVLAENAVMVSRGDGMLRYSDVRNLGMFNNNKNFYGIKALQAGDVVEIAYNGGGNSDGSMKAVPEMTDLFNVTVEDETSTYTLHFTYNEGARTLDYTVYTMTVAQDGPIAFALQTAYIAYIKIIRGEDDPEPEVEYETVQDFNFAEYAAITIGTLGGGNITPTFGEQVNKVNTNVYSISIENMLDSGKVFVNRNSDMLVRYSDVRSIGLYSKSTPTFVIPDLEKDDIVEIAWNAGGNKSDGTYYTIDSTLTSLANIAETGEWGEYAFTHTSGGTERTINYSTRQLKVAADGDVRFAIPSVKGDGSSWKIFIAYIKVLREKDPEPVVETAYYLKNNWNGGEWSWKKMTKDGEIYKLDSVVFGGTGVNLNTAADDADSKWIPVADIQGDDIQANDTVSFTLAISETDTVLTATLIGRPEQPEDVKYYLTGTINSWATADENYLFVANPNVEGEYTLNVTLAVGDGIKVVSSTGTWYPDGMGNEYTVDEAHAGEKVVYFRPVANDEWKTFHTGGFFFIEENSTPEGIENVQDSVQATKLIENGQLYIMYKGAKYNVHGVKQ